MKAEIQTNNRGALLDHRKAQWGCGACPCLLECGGLPDADELWGCFLKCQTCDKRNCPFTCPGKPVEFIDSWREVGGWPPKPLSMINSPDEILPTYLPMIRHGNARISVVSEPMVALGTFDVVKGRQNGTYGLSTLGAHSVRSEFKVPPACKLVLVSVANDQKLERFWGQRETSKIAEALVSIDPVAVTLPNFSFFTDVPRLHTIWNRTRILRVAEEFSRVGLKVILHLNAATDADWNFWVSVLRDHPQIRYVAKEFQTGLATVDLGVKAIQRLSWLQQEVGRSIHPVGIGGGRFAFELQRHFKSFTIIDSNPFVRTFKRRQIMFQGTPRPKWKKVTTPRGCPMDELLASNIRGCRELVLRRIQSGGQSSTLAAAIDNNDDATPAFPALQYLFGSFAV